MRCWGSSTAADVKGLEYEQSRCRMESSIFVSGWLTTGSLSVRHVSRTTASKLGTLRFADAILRAPSPTSRSTTTRTSTAPCRNATSATSIAAACRCARCCACGHTRS